jgi:dihydrofolate reductase
MILSSIVAMSENRVIGANNQLPWHLPEDLKYFKRITMGHPIIMGRKTYESIGRPLPGRVNIVVTRQANWCAEGVVVTHSVDEALQVAARQVASEGVDEVFMIGGEELFRQSLHKMDRIYLTQVHAHIEGDAYFPEFDRSQWEEVERIDHEPDHRNPYAYSFLVLNRCHG